MIVDDHFPSRSKAIPVSRFKIVKRKSARALYKTYAQPSFYTVLISRLKLIETERCNLSRTIDISLAGRPTAPRGHSSRSQVARLRAVLFIIKFSFKFAQLYSVIRVMQNISTHRGKKSVVEST